MFKTLLDAIIDKRWLVFLAVAIAALALAATGQITALKLPDLSSRIAVGLLGLFLLTVGIWDGFRTDNEDKRLNKDYGLKITSPGDNANVAEEFEVEGTYQIRPPKDIPIRTFVCSPSSGNYWPNARPVIFDEANKRWSASIRPGGNVGERKFVGIALLGQNADRLCEYYDKVNQSITELRGKFNQHISLPGVPKVPSDWKECHRIRITRA